MSFVRFLGEAAAGIFSVIFPSDCRICGLPLDNVSRLPVCDQCLEKMTAVEQPRCAVCGVVISTRMPANNGFEARVEETLCGECLKSRPMFERATSYGGYQGGLRELIHLLKYHHVRPAAGVLGRMTAEAATELLPEFSSRNLLVIPVPLHASKVRERGFNQSELIARAALKEMGRDARPRFELNCHVLLRRRATDSQVGLTREQRQTNLHGAFAVADKQAISGREVLLVDDVLTTGATVAECARVLRKAGAAKVWVATAARAGRTADGLPENARRAEGETRTGESTAGTGDSPAMAG